MAAALCMIFVRIIRIYEGKSKKTIVTIDNRVLMPSGMEVPSDSDLLEPKEWANRLERSDLAWIVNYVGHKCDDEKDLTVREKWHKSFEYFSSILYK